jgi:hypothetical protein
MAKTSFRLIVEIFILQLLKLTEIYILGEEARLLITKVNVVMDIPILLSNQKG